MAGKITELTDAGALTGAELVEVVKDPAGTPLSRSTTIDAIVEAVNPLMTLGAQVKLVYRATPARWEFPDGTVPTLTGRSASITWEGTAAQIPAQGTADASFKVGDTALVRSESL
jgi:hypothetical protein